MINGYNKCMFVPMDGQKPVPSQKINSFKLLYDRKRRGSIRKIFGYRFFFSIFTTCFICLSIVMPNSGVRQPVRDFKLPDKTAEAAAETWATASGAALAAEISEAWKGPADPNAPAKTDAKEDEYSLDVSQDFSLTYLKYSADITTNDEAAFDVNTASFSDAASDTDDIATEDALADDDGEATGANNGAGYIILDAGHGGSDPGSIEEGVCEKDIALDVTLLTAELLDEAGVEYILTRATDDYISIEHRLDVINNDQVAFVLSIHCDWYKQKTVNGTSTLYNAGDAASKELAGLMQSYLVHDLGVKDRGIHPHEDIVLLHEARAPAAVAELAFISNKHDLALLKTDQFKIQAARNLAEGIKNAILDGG